MASGDRLHNFPSTISLCSETKRGTFAHQCHKYVTKLSASLHQKKTSISQRFPRNETLVLFHSVPQKNKIK